MRVCLIRSRSGCLPGSRRGKNHPEHPNSLIVICDIEQLISTSQALLSCATERQVPDVEGAGGGGGGGTGGEEGWWRGGRKGGRGEKMKAEKDCIY